MLRLHALLLVTLLAGLVAVSMARADGPARTKPTLDGRVLLDASGEPLLLRGVNLGGWLLIEPWMLGWFGPELPSQHDVIELFTRRFGAERARALLAAWRDNFLVASDFDVIASFGMNCVRLPIHYSVMESADEPGVLRDDAFRYIDWAIEQAERAGLYVILDLHGAPGGQSVDAPTGRTGHNTLWTDPAAQDRTAALWRALAERYRDHPSVAVYDLLNEPYGRFDGSHDGALVALMTRLVREVREIDPVTPIVVAPSLSGIEIYGPPASFGWDGVGFTEHYYPGIFGGEPESLMQHARFEHHVVDRRTRLLEAWDAWMLVGEFNPIFEHVGGARMSRRHFDLFSERGWGSTIWSYKLLKPEGGVHPHNWYMVTNAEPWSLDPFEASDAEILEAFEGLRDLELAVDEEFRRVMNAETPPVLPMPHVRRADPGEFGERAAGALALTDVGGVARGAVARTAEGFVLAGGGHDIWGGTDSFAYLHRAAAGRERVALTVTRFDANDRYAKAGLMLRGGTDASAAHVFVHVFPDGRVVAADRSAAGGPTRERVLGAPGFPVRLAMETDARSGRAVLSFAGAGGISGRHELSIDGIEREAARVGVAVLSHEGERRAVAWVRAPGIGSGGAGCWITVNREAPPAPLAAPPVGSERITCPTISACDADVWETWGSVRTSAEAATAATDEMSAGAGAALVAGSGLWQDIAIDAGQPIRLEADVSLAGPLATADGQHLELRIEVADPERPGAMLRVAERSWPVRELARGPRWSRVGLDAFPGVAGVRVIVANGGDGAAEVTVRRVSATTRPGVLTTLESGEAPQ